MSTTLCFSALCWSFPPKTLRTWVSRAHTRGSHDKKPIRSQRRDKRTTMAKRKKCCRHLVPSSDFFVQSYAEDSRLLVRSLLSSRGEAAVVHQRGLHELAHGQRSRLKLWQGMRCATTREQITNQDHFSKPHQPPTGLGGPSQGVHADLVTNEIFPCKDFLFIGCL